MFAEPAFAAVSEESSVVWENGYITLSSEIITMWVLIALIGIIGYLGTRKSKMVPTGLQNVLEYTIEGFIGFFESILGRERARTFGPYLFTFFILILFSNYVGLLPLAGHLPGYKPPTSNLSVTAALALIVLISYFVLGIRYGGKKFLKFYFGPMILVNLLETITRPLSLALRLYGNIFGEEMIILILFSMVPLFLPLPMYLLSIMFGGIQAFVFTLLTAVYLEEALSGGH